MATSLDIITAALLHLGVQDPAETVSAQDAATCLNSLKSMLDAWQLDPHSVIGWQEFVYTPASGAKSFTIGPAGQVVARMPSDLNQVFYRFNGVDVPVPIVSLEEYNTAALKTVQGFPKLVAYDQSYAAGTVYMYPAANGNVELHVFADDDVVQGFQTLTTSTTLTLPNGYQNALEWNLAEEVMTDFRIADAMTVQKVQQNAARSLRRLKRANVQMSSLDMPDGVSQARAFNIYTG